ncbi:MAG: hypothetical protein KJ950_04080 [Proteobacteria bacterium]|nr:hypothetical protein [Pseudomonadota bacterium]MBU1688385.1 hypothetical protein [Pseudomonadota bacterium]
MNMYTLIRVLPFLLCLLPSPTLAISPIIPEPLQPWTAWVLHGHDDEVHCISDHNNSRSLRCTWPSRLELILDGQGGVFSQEWQVETEQPIRLPGNTPHWPSKVLVDELTVPVLNHRGFPAVWVKPGHHRITGTFQWNNLPAHLPIPPQSGLVMLTLNNDLVPSPNLDTSGRLWLKNTGTAQEKQEDRLIVKSFRLIEDTIPARMVIALDLDVAGDAREIVLGPFFSAAKFTPLALQSPLPARLEEDGRLRIQGRPGRWTLTMTARYHGPLTELTLSSPSEVQPSEEIWSFKAHTDLRIIEIEGVAAIDPQQTNLPLEWRQYPAYRVSPPATMLFKEIKRGDPQPAPDQLALNRTIWLRFDGSGYTLQDTISGRKNSDWRLEMNPPLTLGRVAVDGREQFITQRAEAPQTGVELRQGNLNLVADSTYQGALSTLPAVGWAHDFQQVQAKLMLPPGWRLIHADGIDNVPGTWLNRWTLLDIFMVLIFALAVGHLYSRTLAGIAFITLILTYHEPLAPQWIWPTLLIGFALLKHLPAGDFRRLIKVAQAIGLLALLVIAVPFGINQLRVGIYPQLEKPWLAMPEIDGQPTRDPLQMAPPAPMENEMVTQSSVMTDKVLMRKEAIPSQNLVRQGLSSGTLYEQSKQVDQYDPKMQLQTGPGLPTWQWNTITMGWSGPVRADQQISLLVLGPGTNLILAIARVLLLITLTLGLLKIGYKKGSGFRLDFIRNLFLLGLLATICALPTPAKADQFPSPEILADLQNRLLEKDQCFPDCAALEQLQIDLKQTEIQLDLTLSGRIVSAVPLPGDLRFWQPSTITLDGKTAPALLREGNTLMIKITEGRHHVRLEGHLNRTTIQLPLPMPPQHLTVTNQGWIIEGIRPDGSTDSQLQFKPIREQDDREVDQGLETGVLPPFLQVERTLLLGLTWKVETKVSRLSPNGAAVVVDLPLLPGEAVITDGLRSSNGQVHLNLDARQNFISWESSLATTDQLVLRHAASSQWTEIWRVDVSPIFHLDYQGIPVILHQRGDHWYPTWHPWPGEEVQLQISRPEGVAGQTLTFDRASLAVSPGRRATDTTLTLDLRSSRGGQHTITLPETAELQEVRINNTVQPIRQEGRAVPLPISPGPQNIVLKWRESFGIATMQRTPLVDLGVKSVNTNLELTLPANRWPLFLGGPLMGPAVLFWSVLLIIVLAAFGLARSGMAPLRFHQWLLLGIGMSQSNIYGALLVVGWLVIVELRGRVDSRMDHNRFNLIQIGIGILTLLALAALVGAISRGLLGHPDMNIIGNGSDSGLLRWYQDRSENILPQAWLLSIPMYVYRMAMLLWALWISFTLIRLVKWGWQRFTQPVFWYRPEKKSATDKNQGLPHPQDKKKSDDEALPDLSDELSEVNETKE